MTEQIERIYFNPYFSEKVSQNSEVIATIPSSFSSKTIVQEWKQTVWKAAPWDNPGIQLGDGNRRTELVTIEGQNYVLRERYANPEEQIAVITTALNVFNRETGNELPLEEYLCFYQNPRTPGRTYWVSRYYQEDVTLRETVWFSAHLRATQMARVLQRNGIFLGTDDPQFVVFADSQQEEGFGIRIIDIEHWSLQRKRINPVTL